MVRIDLDSLRAAARDVAREAGLRLVVLYGSAAANEAREPEDLDLGVLPADTLDPVDITNRFIRRLGIQAVDVTDLSRSSPLVLILVARDGMPLYEAEPGTFAGFCSLAARRFADTRKFRELERRRIQEFVERTVQ
jgi:predicted nucleotidyltransferase